MKMSITIAAASALAFAASAAAGPTEELIAKEKCTRCHTATTTKKGPSWASVAEKYKGKPDAAAKLFTQLKNGGKVGDEDDHKKVDASDAEIKAIVAVVLSSK